MLRWKPDHPVHHRPGTSRADQGHGTSSFVQWGDLWSTVRPHFSSHGTLLGSDHEVCKDQSVVLYEKNTATSRRIPAARKGMVHDRAHVPWGGERCIGCAVAPRSTLIGREEIRLQLSTVLSSTPDTKTDISPTRVIACCVAHPRCPCEHQFANSQRPNPGLHVAPPRAIIGRAQLQGQRGMLFKFQPRPGPLLDGERAFWFVSVVWGCVLADVDDLVNGVVPGSGVLQATRGVRHGRLGAQVPGGSSLPGGCRPWPVDQVGEGLRW